MGLRVPANKALQELLALHGAPLLSTTLIAPGDEHPLNDADEICERFEGRIDAVIDTGACPREPTTVIDLSGDSVVVIRQGLGLLSALGL